MLTIFNRRQLTTTTSMERMNRLREALHGAGIESRVKTPGQLTAAGRQSRTGSLGISVDHMYQYDIYVHKNDFSRARGVIDGVLRNRD